MKAARILAVLMLLGSAQAFARDVYVCTATCYRSSVPFFKIAAVTALGKTETEARGKLNAKCAPPQAGFIDDATIFMTNLLAAGSEKNALFRANESDMNLVYDARSLRADICSSLSLD